MNIFFNDPDTSFVTIDVEYADDAHNICQIGLAVVRDLEITDRRCWMIQPPGNRYDERYQKVHHLGPEDTAGCPPFGEVWPEVRRYVRGRELWAHNAASAEQSILTANLERNGFAEYYRIRDSRDLFVRCDCQGGNGLDICCMAMGIDFDHENHHDALYDAVKCAELVIAYANGCRPKWDGVPRSKEEMRKMLQEKVTLRMGGVREFYEGDSSDNMNAFIELTSTYPGSKPQVIDVFDKGDRTSQGAAISVDFTRLDKSEDNPLHGKRVVVTGMFHIDRKCLERAVEEMGARRTQTISSKTDAVILGTRNVGPNKLKAIEEQLVSGRHMALIVGDEDLNALIYGDGWKFFGGR